MPRKSMNNELSKLDAATAEEIDALRIDMEPDPDDLRDPDDGTGIIEDDVARERIEGLTETGPDSGDRGVISAAPGHDDTSRILRRHQRKTKVARAEDLVEDNQDEPRDEFITERKVDEGTAA